MARATPARNDVSRWSAAFCRMQARGESLSTPGVATSPEQGKFGIAFFTRWTPPHRGHHRAAGIPPFEGGDPVNLRCLHDRRPGPSLESQTNRRNCRALICPDVDDTRSGTIPPQTHTWPSIGPAQLVFGDVYPMLIYSRALGACLNHSSLFKVNVKSGVPLSLVGRGLLRCPGPSKRSWWAPSIYFVV
jgi:hypothetical protein